MKEVGLPEEKKIFVSQSLCPYYKMLHCVKVSKYEVFSGPYFPVFSPNTGKSGPEKTPYADTFLAVLWSKSQKLLDGKF